MKKIALIISAAILSTTSFISCEKDNSEPQSENQGEMRVRMTDAPADYEALDVEIASVAIYSENTGWIELNNETQKVSVLELTNGMSTELVSYTSLDAGTYTQLKLVFGEENKLTYQSEVGLNGSSVYTSVTTDLQWNGPKEIIIEIDQEVSANQSADLLLDFDAAASIIESGENYVLDPTIQVIENAEMGILGSIEGGSDAMIEISNGEMSAHTYTSAKGQFLISGLKEGTYVLNVYPSPEEVMQGAQEKITIEGLVVTEGEFTNTGSISIR